MESDKENPEYEIGYVEMPEIRIMPEWVIPLVMVGAILGISIVILLIIRRVKGR